MRGIVGFLIKLIFLSSIPNFLFSNDFDLDKIVADANRTNKQVLLFFHKDGCGFCEKMIFDLEDDNLSKLIKKNFILVDINRDDGETLSFRDYNGTTKGFLKKLDIQLYPTTLFINGEGKFVYGVIGYRNIKKFKSILEYVNRKLYERVTFEEFEDELLSSREE